MYGRDVGFPVSVANAGFSIFMLHNVELLLTVLFSLLGSLDSDYGENVVSVVYLYIYRRRRSILLLLGDGVVN